MIISYQEFVAEYQSSNDSIPKYIYKTCEFNINYIPTEMVESFNKSLTNTETNIIVNKKTLDAFILKKYKYLF
jgi:hypothetical protein